jgi:hypothetical protein
MTRLSEIIYRNGCLALYACIVEFLMKDLNFDALSFSRPPYALRILVSLQLDFYHFPNHQNSVNLDVGYSRTRATAF